MADLSQFDTVAACSKGTDVIIKDALDVPTDIAITVVGVDSPIFREADRKLKGRIQTAEKRKRPLEGQELENAYIDMMVACTLGWKNLQHKGQDVEFSPEKCREVYQGFPIIKSQVYVALYDRAMFLGNSASAS